MKVSLVLPGLSGSAVAFPHSPEPVLRPCLPVSELFSEGQPVVLDEMKTFLF